MKGFDLRDCRLQSHVRHDDREGDFLGQQQGCVEERNANLHGHWSVEGYSRLG